MEQLDMFAEMKQAADTAMREANQDTANELTKKFRSHLKRAGIPGEDVKQSNVMYNKETRDFEADVPDAVQEHSQGDGKTSPSGVVTQFFNRLSSTQINQIHNKYLLERSKAGGLA